MVVRTPLKTLRLVLRLQSLHDFEGYFALSKNPAVMRYIGDGSVFHWTREVALERFKKQLQIQDESQFGPLAVYTADTRRYLGWCAVAPSRFLDAIELGYRYGPDAWGFGYATEAAAALVCNIYRSTSIDQILACTHPNNGASIKVLQKLGFLLDYTKPSTAAGCDLLVYRVDRRQFNVAAFDK